MHIRFLLIRAFVFLTPGIFALGCATTGGPSDKAASEPPTVVVRIGHVGPLTGPVRHLGKDNENGVALAISQVNAQSPVIGGRKVRFELVKEDDRADPRAGVDAAGRLIGNDVAGVVGHLNSGVSVPASFIYNKAGLPVISGSATNPRLTEQGFGNVFRVLGRDDQQGEAIAKVLLRRGIKRVAILDDSSVYGKTLADGVASALRGAQAEVLLRRSGPDKFKEWEPIWTQVIKQDVQAVFYGGMDADAGPLLRKARARGVRSVFAFGDGACSESMPQFVGIDGNFFCTHIGVPANSASPEFVSAYEKMFGTPPVLFAPFTFDATMALITAMKEADSVTPANYLPALRTISMVGATGPISFDAKGDRKIIQVTVFGVGAGNKLVPIDTITLNRGS